MLYREITAMFSEVHTKHINTLWGQNVELFNDMIYDMMIWYDMIWYDMIYLLTAVVLTPGGSRTVQIYTQTIRRRTQWKQNISSRVVHSSHRILEG